MGGRLDITTCEILNYAAAKGMKALLPVTLQPGHVVLFIGVMGVAEAVARQERECQALLPEGVARVEEGAVGRRVRELPWPKSRGASLRDAKAGESKSRDDACGLRLSVPLAATVEMVEAISARPDWEAVAGAGDGTVYALGLAGLEALATLRSAAEKAGGHAVLEYGPVEVKRAFKVWGAPFANLDLMRALKKSLDPSDTMGCGRLV